MKKQLDPEKAVALMGALFAGLSGFIAVEAVSNLTDMATEGGGEVFGAGKSSVKKGKALIRSLQSSPLREFEKKAGIPLTTPGLFQETSRRVGEKVAPYARKLGWGRKGGLL